MIAFGCIRRRNSILNGGMTLLAVLCLFLTARPAFSAGMDYYVQKYDGVEISRSALRKLEAYNELIEYFCGFAFFQPRHKVHPDFIRALILAESEADPGAVSPKDARGLGQILPETGRIAARELYATRTDFDYVPRSRLKDLQTADLHDPAVNILLTCYLISKYNHHYNGRLQLVVSAWNAGANAIADDRPPEYRETLELIGRVNGYFKYLISLGGKERTLSPPDVPRFTNR